MPTTPNPKLERYLRDAKAAGCPQDQAENFLRAGIVLQTKQLLASAAARMCDDADGPTEIGFGGARGGAKSHWMLAQMGADDCVRVPELKCLMLRKVGKANRENFEDLRMRVLQHVKCTYRRGDGVLDFPNRSRIILGHYQAESDIDAYLGLEYDAIGVEECTTLSSSKYKSIRTCNRTSKRNFRPRMYSTTNPGNIGHAYYKAKFIEPYRNGTETTTRFIQSTIDDNAFINPEYRATLDSLIGWQLKAWRHGDWDIAAGQYFTNFRRETHIIDHIGTIPRSWRVWCALDYGFTHYTVCHLIAQDNDGTIFILDEHAERGWLPARHADSIFAMLDRNGIVIHQLTGFVAGDDVFAKRGVTGATIADAYAECGIILTSANMDRLNGAGEMLNRFGDVDSEANRIEPRLFITSRCAGLIETIPSLQHDPHRPEDVLKVDTDEEGLGGDDFYDCARYGIMEAWGRRGAAVAGPPRGILTLSPNAGIAALNRNTAPSARPSWQQYKQYT
jgi:hypothetical protein